ncbi:MAG: phage tail tape measure protein [Salinivirgaceae bacterium]
MSGNLIFESSVDARALYKEIVKIEKNISRLTSHAETQTAKMDSVFRKAATAIGGYFTLQAFGQATKGLYQFSTDINTALTEVVTISDEVFGKYDYYKEQILEVSTLGSQSGKALSEAMYDIVSAGYDGEAGLEVLRKSAQASTAGFVETAVAADGLTTVLNAWGKEASEAEAVSDVFFKTVEKGKTTFPELASKMAIVAPLASSMGVSFEEVSAAVASITKQGTPTAQAMTQIRSSLINMNKVLGDGWSDTMSYQEGLQKISEMAGGSQNELRKLIPDIEGISAVLALTGDKAKVAASDLDAMNNAFGATSAAAAKVEQSTADIVSRLRNNILKQLSPLGDSVIETVGSIGSELNEAFETGRIDEFFDNLGKTLKVGAALMLVFKANTIATTASLAYQEVALRILIAREELLNRWTKITAATQLAWNSSSAAGVGILGKLTAATRALFATMAVNPFAAIIAVIGLATAAFALFNRKTDDARNNTKNLNAELTEFQKQTAAEQGKLNSLFEALKSTNEGTRERRELIKEINSQYGDYLPSLLTEKSTLEEIQTAQKLANEELLKNIAIKSRQNELSEASTKFMEAEKRVVESVRKAISDTGNQAFSGIGTAAFKDLIDSIGEADVQISQFGESTITTFSDDINKSLIDFADRYGITIEGVFNQIGEYVLSKDTYEDALQSINDFYDNYIKNLGKLKDKPEGTGTGETETLFDAEGLKQELAEARKAFDEYEKLQSKAVKADFAANNQYVKGNNSFADYLMKRYAEAKEIQEKALIEIAASESDIVLSPIRQSNLTKIQPKGASPVSDDRGLLQQYADQISAIDKQINKAKDEERIKDLVKEKAALEAKRSALLTYKDDSDSIYKKLFADISGKRNKELREQLAAIDIQIAKEKQGSLQQIELAKKRGEIEKELRENTIQSINDMGDLFGSIAGLLDNVDSDLSKVFETASKVASGVASIASGILSGNYIQAVASGISLISELIGELFNSGKTAAEYRLEAEKILRQIELLQMSQLQLQQEARNNKDLFGIGNPYQQAIDGAERYKIATSNLANLIDDLNKETVVTSQKWVSGFMGFGHWTDVHSTLEEAYGWIYDPETFALNPEIIANYDKLDESGKNIVDNWEDYTAEVKEAQEDIRENLMEIVGDMGNDITEILLEAFRNGDIYDAIDDMGAYIDNMIAKLLVDILIANTLGPLFKDLGEGMYNSFYGDNPDYDITDDLADFKNKVPGMMGALELGLTEIRNMYPDVDIFNPGTVESSNTSTAGAVKNVQEDTAQILAGRLINIDTKVIESVDYASRNLDIGTKSLAVLNAIKQDTARLENIEKYTKETRDAVQSL